MKIYLIAVFLLVALSNCTVPPAQTTLVTIVPTVTEEPFYAWDFTIMSLDGGTYTLSEMKGKWVIINFWATWCGPCREEMPVLQSIHDDYSDLTVLAINQRETVDVVRGYVTDAKLSFPILVNPSDQVLLNYSVVGLPQTVVVNPDGIIVWRQFGPLELDTFSMQIDTLRSG